MLSLHGNLGIRGFLHLVSRLLHFVECYPFRCNTSISPYKDTKEHGKFVLSHTSSGEREYQQKFTFTEQATEDTFGGTSQPKSCPPLHQSRCLKGHCVRPQSLGSHDSIASRYAKASKARDALILFGVGRIVKRDVA